MKVLIFGDSLADGLEVEECDCTVASRWGASTEMLRGTFPSLGYYLGEGKGEENQFDVVVLIGGSNDLHNDALPMFAIDNLMRMHRLAKSKGVPISMGITLLNDRFNKDYRNRLAALKLPLCEFLHEAVDTKWIDDDGIHLNPEGKQELSRQLTATLKTHLINRALGFIFPPRARSVLLSLL